MPPRRRATPSAAKLPASRLPFGTYLPGDSRPTSRNTDRSVSSPPTASSEPDTAAHIDIKNHPAYTSIDTPSEMASFDMPPTGQPTYSLAEAKLRRQQDRIENAEAALAAPHHLDRREPSRGKSKPAWKPLNIEWDTTSQAKNEGGIPVQTRTNVIYGPAFSRETSLSRSLSSVSQQTTATDAPRHDSLVDDHGFQVYHGRRGRKHTDELGATEDAKPEARQSTVEGNFDKREMYKVFGLELPGLDFISSNCGFKDGQLQFVRHPNGDVSAHMWCKDRYVWENIGDFSNIRKRIGGLLASDRLKGETGWQMLQRNTLAYFRAIAKQREQNALGIEFGQAEIQQILPKPTESIKASAPSRPTSPSVSASSRRTSALMPPPLFNTGQQQSAAPSSQRSVPQPQQTQAPPAARGFPFLPGGQAAGKEDPFNPSAIFLPAKEPAVPTARAAPTVQPNRHQTFASNLSNPFVSNEPTPCSAVRNASSRERHVATTASVVSGLPQLNIAKLGAINIGQQVEQRQTSGTSSDTPSRKQATPTSTREAMREQLWKVSEFAQKRSNSQANIRTVLHDPFKAPSVQSEDSKAEHFPDLDLQSETDGSFIYTEDHVRPHQSWRDLQPNLNAPKPEPIPVERPEENLADSVPDNDTHSVGSRVTSFQSSGATYVVDDLLLANTTSVSNKSYDEELKDWWTSGTQFARQEDLYQRIKALEISRPTPQAPRYTNTTPSTRPRLIGAPPSGRHSSSIDSPQKADVPFNKTITRMLIPVCENLASYVQGPIEQRRDYWSNWSQPPEWCIDRSPNGNNSFYDGSWGQPPARVGRDPRYRPLPGELRFGGFSPGAMTGSPRGVGIPGMRGSLGFGGVGTRY